MPLYGQPLYGGPIEPERLALWQQRCVDAGLPGPYAVEARDFWNRAFSIVAEELAAIDRLLDRFDLLLYAESAPEEWIDWILQEWFGWTLIPEGYPLSRRRRLLYRDQSHNLALHYQRRYTVVGIRELLREFGVIADVVDRPLYVGDYLTTRGVTTPLNVWVRILYREPWESPKDNYIGNYVGHTYVYRTQPLVTNQFICALCEWSRAAGTRMIVEFVFRNQRRSIIVSLFDEPARLEIEQPVTQEGNITE